MRCGRCGNINPDGAEYCYVCKNPLVAVEKSTALPGEDPGFWMRFAACGIDGFIVIALPSVISWLVDRAKLGDFLLSPVYLIPALGHWLLTGLTGQSMGKRLFRMKAVGKNGESLGLARAFLREFIGKPLLFFGILLFLVLSFSGASPGAGTSGSWGSVSFHDTIARSKVVWTEKYEAVKTSWAWWLLEFLPSIGSVLGLIFLWKKDRRKAWAIFFGGLFLFFILVPIVLLIVMLAAA